MPQVVSLLILAFAVSLDGFGVGATYGLRKIRMPISAIGIISLFSGVVIFGSMKIGQVVAALFSPKIASIIGAAILMAIGIWTIVQMLTQKEREAVAESADQQAEISASAEETEPKSVLYIEIKRLGVIIQILRTPSAADVDRSGYISASEAALLGLALSLDAFGAGLGAALIGYNPIFTAALIALASGTFVSLGMWIGLKYADLNWLRKLSVLPGLILIVIGILKML